MWKKGTWIGGFLMWKYYSNYVFSHWYPIRWVRKEGQQPYVFDNNK